MYNRLKQNNKMKKSIILMMAAIGLLTACDPSKDDIGIPGSNLSEQELSDGFSFKQYDETYTEEKADGNYFTFFTSPSRVVRIYQKDADGVENVLVSGVANGKFKIVPKRGNPNEQTFYVETMNFDGSKVVITKECNVYVPSELTPEMRLLASDAYGYKVWTWDTEWRADGGAWGNMGYSPGDGDSFVNDGNGIWWACAPADLIGQLNHSNTGVATGEENPGAYMEFYDDGNIKTYDAGGNQIRSGKYSVEGWTGERNHASADGNQANWSYGTLKTTAGAILWPFGINNNKYGREPLVTEFEIMQLDANHLKLIYPITAETGAAGNWSEATWWAFKSVSDPEAALTNFESKSWTWDIDWRSDNGAWGNMGYVPGDGDSFVNDGNGIWWGCAPADLVGQLNHSDTGVATGEEDPNAYMTIDWKTATIESFDASGKKIRGGKFEIRDWAMGKRIASHEGSQESWSYGKFITDQGAILWPFGINNNKYGRAPIVTEYEIMQLDKDHFKLIYPICAETGVAGGWSEATWWAFKKK